MSGSTVGGLLGAAIGSAFGSPQIGFAIGSMLGGALDPVRIKGPRLSDARQQTAQAGTPIPFGYGTFPCAGNLIWADVLVEHKHEDDGKGGPVTTTFTYTRSYAIGICKGPITGIQKIKRNGKLVYDISPGSALLGTNSKFLQKCTIYLGDESQTVDPTIEAVVGVGNSGPMRGLAYIVMEDDELTDEQGAVPQFEFVVQMCGTVTDIEPTPDSSTVLDLDAAIHGGSAGAGLTISGLSASDTVFVTLPSGETFDGWSNTPPHATDWTCYFKVTNAAAVTTEYLPTATYTSGALALAAAQGQTPILLTGSTSYTFWIPDAGTYDNLGGVSLKCDVFPGDYSTYYEIPDAPGMWADQDGVLLDDQVYGSSLSSCGAYLDDIVLDLCEQAGIDSTEVDVTDLSAIFVKGFKCAADNGTAQGYIEALGNAFLFDRGEWDKKIRFIRRGGTSVASLTVDDLVALDGPPIKQTRVQEVELLRKVTVLAIDPAADYNVTPQDWERRVGTVQALGEMAIDIPVVMDTDTQKALAKKKVAIAWAENEKKAFGLTVKYSKLTPTDIVTLADKGGITHSLRITDQNEESGVFMVEEAVKTRASIYALTATGTVNENTGGTTAPGLIGPTLFAAMNLPQLRTQDNSPGMYIGACGILDGWSGCQILLSLDGGVSYSVALSLTAPTKMGTLTDNIADSGTPLSVHVFGGDLAAATTAQVTAGANLSAVISAGVSEILGYEAIAESPANYYDLTTLTRGLKGTTAAAHVEGDQFVDLNTAYFLPIDQTYAGDTLYFKAVAFGVSADAVDPVAVVFEGSTYVIDGGGA